MEAHKKIAIIVQRFGKEVNGGAEVHARLLAQKLSEEYEVTILTSLARDYTNWRPYFAPGQQTEGNLKIIRFTNAQRASQKRQSNFARKMRLTNFAQKSLHLLGVRGKKFNFILNGKLIETTGLKWLEAQGPAMPDLIHYLKNNQACYDAFIIFTALYYPGALSALTVPEKAILIPTLHDEKPSYFPVYKKVFELPEWLFFNTNAEQKLAERIFSLRLKKKKVVGLGIDLVKDKLIPEPDIPLQYDIKNEYIIYVGRIDKLKGCGVLLKYFKRFQKGTKFDLQLVLVGENFMKPASEQNIVFTGFVDEPVKQQLMLQAKALIIPSFNESFSLAMLESFAMGVPVIANGNTEVLRNHIVEGNGGWCYYNYLDFKNAMIQLLTNPELVSAKRKSGYQYVREKYSWDRVMNCYKEAIDNISSKSKG